MCKCFMFMGESLRVEDPPKFVTPGYNGDGILTSNSAGAGFRTVAALRLPICTPLNDDLWPIAVASVWHKVSSWADPQRQVWIGD